MRVQSALDTMKTEGMKTWSEGSGQRVVTTQMQADPLRADSGSKNHDLEVDRLEVEGAVESINGAIEHINKGLRFSIHEDTNRIMVKVVDVLTSEVIKEIPPEDVLDTVARIREAIGLLVDEKA